MNEDTNQPTVVRDIQYVRYSGESQRHRVRVHCVCRMDPYMGDTLMVHREAGEGIITLMADGTWGTYPEGVMPDRQQGFEMPAGFTEALRDAMQGELQEARTAKDAAYAMLGQLDEAAGKQIESLLSAAQYGSVIAGSAVKRIEQLEAQVEGLADELEAWREGQRTR